MAAQAQARPSNIAELEQGIRTTAQDLRKPRNQELTEPLKDSRKKLVEAYITQHQESEQEIEALRNRLDDMNRELEKERVIAQGYKSDFDLERARSKTFEDERDAAVHERIRLETIFGTMKNLMAQADFEIQSAKDAA